MKIFVLLLFSQLFLYSNNISIEALDKAIKLYETNDGHYVGGDALSVQIRKNLDIDIYTGEHSVYFEWDEKDYDVKYVKIYQDNFTKPIKIIKNSASEIGHKWNGYVSFGLKKSHTYNYKVELLLQNGKKIRQNFTLKTKNGIRRIQKRVFKIYDDLEGNGQKSEYLKKNIKDGTMKVFGLENSAMFWIDDFFSPVPLMGDGDKSQILTQPQLKKLQKLVFQQLNSKYFHNVVKKDEGMIVLDIEHIPSMVSYAEKEFSSYGSLVARFYDTPKMEQNGRKIVSQAIAKKLKSIKAVKEILPFAKVGLWDSIVPWYRYDEVKRNRDHIALAKGIDIDWLRNYETWHKTDSIIYKQLIDVVDYVMPSLYPAFDLSDKKGRKKQLGFMLSKLMEIKRLNPDVVVIPSICPQYTEAWTDRLGYDKKPLQKGVFTWYINQLYFLYQNGFIDSVEIWGDNEKTSFIDFTKQDWWFELIQFTNAIKKP